MKQKQNDMKIQAKEVKKGNEVKFGWNQWLLVDRIEKAFQKNGKEITIFHGSSKQEKPTRRGARKYPTILAKKSDQCAYKSETIVDVR